MNALLKLPTDLTRSHGLTLIFVVDKARAGITGLIAALILRGPLFIVAASEWLPAYELARMIRKRTREVRETLDGLHTVRASTCYRLLDSLANIPPKGGLILVLDFLHTFYDADIPLRVRFHKLRECCRKLKLLAFYRPVIVITQEMQTEDYKKFVPILCSIVNKTFTLELEIERIKQQELL